MEKEKTILQDKHGTLYYKITSICCYHNHQCEAIFHRFPDGNERFMECSSISNTTS
ncbi:MULTISPECIES: hypothetical protein [Bacilli]|uniref:hypothetical protein n=1 Tax=Bacilli TaxID=91061 RepID=UPI002AA5A680